MPSPPPPPALAHDYNLWDVVFPKPRAYPGLELIQPSQYNLSGYAPSESFKVKISLKTEDENAAASFLALDINSLCIL